MDKRLIVLGCCLAGLGVYALTGAAPREAPRPYPLNPPLAASWAAPRRLVLNNGLVVFLYPVADMDRVDIRLRLHAGYGWDPEDRRGLAAAALEALRRVLNLPPGLGATIAAEFDAATVKFASAQDRLRPDLEHLVRSLAHPDPGPDIWQAACRQGSRPGAPDRSSAALARRSLGTMFWGGRFPVSPVNQAGAEPLALADARNFYREFLFPANMVIGIWGKFDPEAMPALLEQTLGAWAHAGQRPRSLPWTRMPRPAGFQLVDRQGFTQTMILLGKPDYGRRLSGADRAAFNLVNRLLGQGFCSRLFNAVRSRDGLAYEIFTSWEPGWRLPGWYWITSETRTPNLAKMLAAIRRELERLRLEGVSAEELQAAKDAWIRNEIFEFDSADKIVNRSLLAEFYGLPQAYADAQTIAGITADDIRRVLDFFDPQTFGVVLVGPQDQLNPRLPELQRVWHGKP